MCHNSKGLILWKSQKDNEVQQVEVESYPKCTMLEKRLFTKGP
jgi:hypothetical protein